MSKTTRSTRPVTRAYAAQHQIKIDPLPPASYHPEPNRRRSQNRNNKRITLNSTQRRQSTRKQRGASSQQSRRRNQQRKTTLAQIEEESSSPQQEEELEIRDRQLIPYYNREESRQQIFSPQYLQIIPESESSPYRLHENDPIITSATGVSHDSWFNYYDSPDLTGQNPEEFDSYSSDTPQSQLPDFLSTSTQPTRDDEGIEMEFQQEQPMRRSAEHSGGLVRYNAFYYEDDYGQQMTRSQRRQPVSAFVDVDGSLIRNSTSYSQTDNVRRNRQQNNSYQPNGTICNFFPLNK
ncbi:5181_t:CDS:1 [Dentiscutata heterogama]|uniref:5181_t:CDS:1 n=1 Tax=Dentiscutata heterogama TaxID=1316150 RepID=A0ACA9K2F2_9GLOM|nr:5181_t:CDS:1 [Dentiscutata heterogama]